MKFLRKIFNKRKNFLGIDIGTSSIKIVEVKKKGNDFFLENYVENSYGLEENKQNKLKNFLPDEGLIANKIKEMCERAKIFTKDANISIPDFYTFYANFTLPAMAKEEIIQAIEYEVRPHVPLPISEITLDWTIIEGEISKTPLKILVVAVPNNIISQYKNIAKLSELRLKFLESEVVALSRALIGEEDRKEIIGLVDLGIKSTTCSILDNGILKRSHSFRIGGGKFTEKLANSLNISYNEAKKLQREKGISQSKEVKEILCPLIDSCLEEMEKVFRDYSEKEGKKVQKVIIAGGFSLLPGLIEYFSVRLEKKVEFADPFKNISYPDALKNLSKERKMSLSIPIGVAIK